MHAVGKELVIDVAGWSHLLSNYSAIASAGVDQLQDMSFYARPGSYKEELAHYFAEVKQGASGTGLDWSTQAGVGIGVYYNGNGYPKEWNETTARAFTQEVAAQGGNALDIFRLNRQGPGGKYNWPTEPWWVDVIHDFATGK